MGRVGGAGGSGSPSLCLYGAPLLPSGTCRPSAVSSSTVSESVGYPEFHVEQPDFLKQCLNFVFNGSRHTVVRGFQVYSIMAQHSRTL